MPLWLPATPRDLIGSFLRLSWSFPVEAKRTTPEVIPRLVIAVEKALIKSCDTGNARCGGSWALRHPWPAWPVKQMLQQVRNNGNGWHPVRSFSPLHYFKLQTLQQLDLERIACESLNAYNSRIHCLWITCDNSPANRCEPLKSYNSRIHCLLMTSDYSPENQYGPSKPQEHLKCKCPAWSLLTAALHRNLLLCHHASIKRKLSTFQEGIVYNLRESWQLTILENTIYWRHHTLSPSNV